MRRWFDSNIPQIRGVGLIVGRGCMCTDEMWVQLPYTSPKFFFKKILTNQFKYAIIIIEREVRAMSFGCFILGVLVTIFIYEAKRIL